MSYSGVILDRTDDRGATLKAKFPKVEELPDVIKTAQFRSYKDIPSDDFALVAVENDQVIQKYACNNAGETATSVVYFMEHGVDKLPDEAVKTAAKRLFDACCAFHLLPPAKLSKLAACAKPKKIVDLTGKKVLPKVKTSAREFMWKDPETNQKHFPLDSWDQIKMAERYLQDEGLRLRSEIRRECSVKLAARAKELGYPLDEKIKTAGSLTFASPSYLRIQVELRKKAAGQEEFLDELIEKQASIGPEMYAECLRRFDIDYGLDQWWGSEIPDPWESTFGISKTAEVVWEHGLDRVTEASLRNLAENHAEGVENVFSSDIRNGFVLDPVGVFRSLPKPEQKIMARLAMDMASQGGTEGTLT